MSEIAKQQRDNAAAGDLLERALFSFGRAIHSTFANNLSQGKARLDFRRPENREFWLAVWRYVANLGVRSTWRTAFEWTKLLLSVDPNGDPYCLRLCIDQMALRGREPQALIDIVNTDHLERRWKVPPNLAFSVSLAHAQLKENDKARSRLNLAIKEYPWVAARLCKELEITPIPKAIWGKEPNDDYQELLCQLYVTKAKDLWNTPEATSLLVSVAMGAENVGGGENPYWLERFDKIKVARHIILTEDRVLLGLLDRSISAKHTSNSDPLPPADNLPSYRASSTHGGLGGLEDLSLSGATAEMIRLRDYFNRLAELVGDVPEGIGQDVLERQLEAAGTDLAELRSNTARYGMLRTYVWQQAAENAGEEQESEPTDSDN